MSIWKSLGEGAEMEWGVTFSDVYRNARAQPSWNINSAASYTNVIKGIPDHAFKACAALETRAVEVIKECNDSSLLKDPSLLASTIFSPLRHVIRESLMEVATDCTNRGIMTSDKVRGLASNRVAYISIHIDAVVASLAERMRFRAKEVETSAQEFEFKKEQHGITKSKFALDKLTAGVAIVSGIIAILAAIAKQSWLPAALLSALTSIAWGLQHFLSPRRPDL